MKRIASSSPVAAGRPAATVSRTRRALSLGAVAASFTGAAAVVQAQGSLRTVKMAAQNPFQMTDYPAMIADRQGFFAKQGIKAEFTAATNALLPLLSGDIDITTVGSANGLLALAKQQDFQFIAVCVPRSVLALLVKPDSPIAKIGHRWPQTFQALRGKTLGVTVPGALIDQMGRWMSAMAGMTPDKDITVQAAGDATLLLANLEKGVYDAALQISPLFELAQQRKMAVSVMDFYKGEGPPELAAFPFATPATRKSFADKNPDLINRYIAAMQKAVDFARKPENRGKVLELVSRELKVDPQTQEGPVSTFISSIGSVKMTRQQWQAALSMMKTNGTLKDDIPFETGVFAGARA